MARAEVPAGARSRASRGVETELRRCLDRASPAVFGRPPDPNAAGRYADVRRSRSAMQTDRRRLAVEPAGRRRRSDEPRDRAQLYVRSIACSALPGAGQAAVERERRHREHRMDRMDGGVGSVSRRRGPWCSPARALQPPRSAAAGALAARGDGGQRPPRGRSVGADRSVDAAKAWLGGPFFNSVRLGLTRDCPVGERPQPGRVLPRERRRFGSTGAT